MAGRDAPDVIGEVLEAARFSTLFFGRFELGAPWALAVPAKPTSSFYVMARGGARLTLEGEREAIVLAPGDLVLLPRGAAHQLSDGSRGAPIVSSEALLHAGARRERLGGDGPPSTLISGCFRFSAGASHPLLRSLPSSLLFRGDDPKRSAALAATVSLITLESSVPEAGSAIVLGRLTDVLLVHALRNHASRALLPGLADPNIAQALSLIHGNPGDEWTVEKLAASAGLSRSGFAKRFQELVGEPPLRYLTQWRMMKAASWLGDRSVSVDQVAAQLGYESTAAFQKAFKRWQGVGPGAFRKQSVRASGPQSV